MSDLADEAIKYIDDVMEGQTDSRQASEAEVYMCAMSIEIAKLRAQVAEREWISVDERLPDCLSVQYIGQVPSASMRWREYTEQFVIMPAGIMHYECKYWQPLPDPPKN